MKFYLTWSSAFLEFLLSPPLAPGGTSFLPPHIARSLFIPTINLNHVFNLANSWLTILKDFSHVKCHSTHKQKRWKQNFTISYTSLLFVVSYLLIRYCRATLLFRDFTLQYLLLQIGLKFTFHFPILCFRSYNSAI